MPPRAPRDALDRALFLPLFAALLVLAAGLSLAYAHPPLVDWPEHRAQDAIVAHLRDPRFAVARYYRTTGWFLPYQGFRWLHIALARSLGDDHGGRVALLPYLVGVPLAVAALLRRLGRDRWTALASFTVLVEANFLWGFAPHALGTALLLTGIVLAMDALEHGRAWRVALLALLGVALFFTHAQQTAVWGLSCIVLAVAAWRRALASPARALAVVTALLPAGALLAVYLLGAGWLTGDALRGDFPLRAGTLWHTPWMTVKLAPLSTGLGVLGAPSAIAYIAAVLALAVGALRAPRRATAPRAPWDFAAPLLFALYTALWFALPAESRGQTMAPRVASLAALALLWALSWRAPGTPAAGRARGPLRIALALAAFASLLHAHRRFAEFDRTLAPLDGMLARIPYGSRVAGLAYAQRPPSGYRVPVYMHVSGYAVAERGGMASAGFVRTGVTYRDEIPRAALTVNELWRPSLSGWQLDPLRHGGFYDFVLVITGPRYPGTPFGPGAMPARVTRIERAGVLELWRVER